MPYVKRPNGFRAVRMRGKTEVVYCVEHKEFKLGRTTVYNVIQAWSEDGKEELHTKGSFCSLFAREHSQIPQAVSAFFVGKPSFAEWWDARQK